MPIYEKRRKDDPRDFRPVSLISVLGTVMEQIILGAVRQHLRDSQGIRLTQRGFMRGRLGLTNLISFCDKKTHVVDKGKAVDIALQQHL